MAKVFLSAGHGGKDPGAAAFGLKEKTINLNILKACRDELKRHDVTVVCSRTTDENDPVSDEVKEANTSNADIAVSFHTNAGGGDGSETYYYPGDEKGEKLAKLCEKYTKRIGQNSRGIKSGKHLHFINSTNMTAVLCECAFVDNDKDNNIIDTTAEQKKFGVAYAKAILEFLGIKYKEASTTKTETTKTHTTSDDDGSFKVKVEIKNLNIRKGPGTNYGVVGKYTGVGTFTIVDTAKGPGASKWGLLSSYRKKRNGWISLDFAKRI